MKQFTLLNTSQLILRRTYVFLISSSGSANSNASKAVKSSYIATHMLSCFVVCHLMARRQRPIAIVLFCSFSLSFMLFTPTLWREESPTAIFVVEPFVICCYIL